ncbi:hypothetical protein F4815DRAFT_476675 [Daldinia loculata]|nr:hypothetical protein F4815DRAFT_476675 [Daldinia loculata]
MASQSTTSSSSSSAPPGHTPAHRIPTDSSYYSFNGNPWDRRNPESQTWMYAREARQQQSGLPDGQGVPYPSYFGNGERVSLSTPGSALAPSGRHGWLHHPLIPGRTTTWTPGSNTRPGGVRSIYTDGNIVEFDVGYHDVRIGTTGRGSGKFAVANYHSAAAPPPPRTRTT